MLKVQSSTKTLSTYLLAPVQSFRSLCCINSNDDEMCC